MLIIAPLPAPFPSVATHRERVQARPNKPRSQVVTWMSVHMPMQRTYEGLWQRVINSLYIPVLALCVSVAINAPVSPREAAYFAVYSPTLNFLRVMVFIDAKINGGVYASHGEGSMHHMERGLCII